MTNIDKSGVKGRMCKMEEKGLGGGMTEFWAMSYFDSSLVWLFLSWVTDIGISSADVIDMNGSYCKSNTSNECLIKSLNWHLGDRLQRYMFSSWIPSQMKPGTYIFCFIGNEIKCNGAHDLTVSDPLSSSQSVRKFWSKVHSRQWSILLDALLAHLVLLKLSAHPAEETMQTIIPSRSKICIMQIWCLSNQFLSYQGSVTRFALLKIWIYKK